MLKKSADYPLIMVHAVRHVGLALEGAAPAALSFADLAKGYNHLNSGDLTRVRNIEGAEDNRAAAAWIIRYAVSILSGVIVDEGMVSFAPGKGFDDLTYHNGEKATRPGPNPYAKLDDPFNPINGKFSENIREKLGDVDELRESMKAWGWIDRPQFRGLGNSRTKVILIGHRRIAVAEELGIEWQSHIDWVDFGHGDAADAERLKLAIASNIGGKALSPNDRKRIAAHLYDDGTGWSQERIAEVLNVAQMTVSRDLSELNTVFNSKHPKTASNPKGAGRPKKTVIEKALSRTGITPEQETQVAELTDAGWTKPQIAEKLGIGKGQVENSRQRHIGRTIQSALLADNPVAATEDHLCTCLACGNRHNRS